MNEEEELGLIVAGDSACFGRWVTRVEIRLRRSLTSFTHAIDVEAVVQETFLRVWQVAPRLHVDGRDEPLTRFAIRVARNLAIDEVRKTKATPFDAPVLDAMIEAGAAVSVDAPDPWVRTIIAECRQQLPRQPAAAFNARLEAHGVRDDAELAKTLDMKTNTFLKNVGRARKLLIECLQKRGVEMTLNTEAPRG